MTPLDFYLNGILIYVPLAFVLSYAFSVYHEYSGMRGKNTKANVNKPIVRSVKNKVSKVIPDKKVGYCSCCETYLLDDSYYYSHVDGKKHKNNVTGIKNWISFVSQEEYANNNKAKKVQKARVQAVSEDYDEGWIL